MSNFLQKIAAIQRQRIEAAQKIMSTAALELSIAQQPKPRGFQQQIVASSLGIIAEVKFASPSAGRIYTGTKSEVEIAKGYIEGGASVLSVLTEPDYFQGSPEILKSIRHGLPDVCLLRKDFMIDPYQILEARAWGADAILLIVAMLSDDELSSMHAFAKKLGMDVLVEAHDEQELVRAHAMGATLIGINNRNLKSLVVDVQTSVVLASQFKSGVTYISESGIEDPQTIKKLQKCGYHGFLIGSHFMRHPDPQQPLQQLVQACV